MFFSLPLRRLVGVLAAAVALPACDCPANMSPPPVFTLAFSTDTMASTGVGFRKAEVRSAYIVRYRDADFQSMDDTLRQPTAATANSKNPEFGIYYRPGYPPQFALPDFERQNTFARSFRLVVPAANRTYDINNVVLKEEPGESRCSGYRITRREATINGQLRDGLKTSPILTK
ncbi:hypothetical protein GCM10022409_16220 [Hymenobacter glaciei]|uniref:Lipoprotein n=1 Tax=Hymenobacter glaciei TaxID=877209 RepID=A0ABP7TXJ8_9BACT